MNLEVKDDLKYHKYCVDDFWSRPFYPRETPLDLDVEKEYEVLKSQAIKDAVNGAKILSVTSKNVMKDFSLWEEVTICYE